MEAQRGWNWEGVERHDHRGKAEIHTSLKADCEIYHLLCVVRRCYFCYEGQRRAGLLHDSGYRGLCRRDCNGGVSGRDFFNRRGQWGLGMTVEGLLDLCAVGAGRPYGDCRVPSDGRELDTCNAIQHVHHTDEVVDRRRCREDVERNGFGDHWAESRRFGLGF